jgi:hypothetical protein
MPSLDHVAIHVADRDAFADQLVTQLDVRVIERTDRFTLVGADPDFGKLTLLDPVDDRSPSPNRIVSIVLAEVGDRGTPAPLVLEGGLVLTFASLDDLGPAWDGTPRHAVVGIVLRVSDPPLAAALIDSAHPLQITQVAADHAILEVGDGPGAGRITLTREGWDDTVRPSMIDHVGFRITDAHGWRRMFEECDVDVDRWVEAAHSRAVFVEGPEGLLLEYVELTAPLAGA